MENTISLELITITDQSIIRAMRHVRTQPYSPKAIEKDPTKKDRKVSILNIGGKVFSADAEDNITKIIMEGRQAEIYSVSFTKGEEYTDSKGAKQTGINFSSFLPKKQYAEDIAFEQEIILAKSRAELEILETKARIRKDYYIAEAASLPDLEHLISGKE